MLKLLQEHSGVWMKLIVYGVGGDHSFLSLC